VVVRDIVVIGASAGGIESLQNLIANLPTNLAASLFVVVHTPSWHRSELPAVLSRAGRLPAVHPQPGEQVQPGYIYVAPPDHHLLTENSHVQLWRGPKENRHRPSVNVLFRSAAVRYGSRVVGIVLSGALEDGAAGLWWIKKYGGVTIVQDPSDARFPDMPQHALEYVDPDYILPARDMGALLADLANGRATSPRSPKRVPLQEELR